MKLKLIILFMSFLTASVDAAQSIAPSDTMLRYTGRWDFSNLTQPWAYAKGTSIIANFQGSSLSATFSATSTDYLRIIIDNDAALSEKIPISSSNASYVLAAGLADKVHRIEIVKETDAGRWTFHGFELDDWKDLTELPPGPTHKLVFYGDSNLAGYSLEHEQNQSGQGLRGSYYGYAGIVSRMLDAEYSNISRSGASINSLHASYDRIDWYTPGSLWDFANFQPDAVVINIGANDVGRPKRKIKKDYHALLDDMRASYLDAHIMLYNAWGWDYKEPANYIHEVIAERIDDGDINMSFAIFPWLFEQWHGCEYDHSGMAHLLADHLASVLDSEPDDWTPAAADVMNGYDTDGNVANGSFEESAPFGGYGWRYFTDAGVNIIHDPDFAADGEYFLQLSNGAASHQPNPATAGEAFTVTVSMRGAFDGEQVEMTMDFRDQKMWTEPLESATDTHSLEAEKWQTYTMTATAPVGTAKPVFHTRLSFKAAPGSTVYIDNVVMSKSGDTCTDNDSDGYGNPGSLSCAAGSATTDCDDTEWAVNPGATEICGNGIDDDCDILTPDDGATCQSCDLAGTGESCISGSDCCSGSCSKGKPSTRICL